MKALACILWLALSCVAAPPLFFAQNGATTAETNVLDGFTHYWIADDISGVDGDPVGTWPDGIASNDATAAGSARPTLRTADINGKNSVEFDGVDDGLGLPSITVSEATGFSLFCVAYVPTSTTTVFGLASTGLNERPYQLVQFNDGNTYAASDLRLAYYAESSTGWRYAVATVSSGLIDITINGAPGTESYIVSSASTYVDRIGSASPFFGSGKLAFVGIKTGTPDPAFVAAFDAWAASYYGLP